LFHSRITGLQEPDDQIKEKQQQNKNKGGHMKLFFVILAGVLALLAFLAIVAKRRSTVREAFIDDFKFPDGIAQRVRKRYPHLTDEDMTLVFAGLRQYFQISRLAGRRLLSMPSQVVDVAWHEFILFTRNYQVFCDKSLGRFLHHTPAEAMRGPQDAQEGIRRAWRLACGLENISPRTPPRLPLLFSLDDTLRIPDGFRYSLNCMAAAAVALPAGRNDGTTYCASHIGCGSGGGDGGCSNDSGCSGGGCGGD
jgi:hypothetical protein